MVRKTAFSYASHNDCSRFEIDPILSFWAREWIKEQIDPSSELAVFVNRPDGNYLEIYKPLIQPHPFHNIIYPFNSVHPGFIMFNSLPISSFSSYKKKFTQICSTRGLQCVKNNELSYLFAEIENKLEINGTFFFAVTHYFNLNDEAVNILSDSPILKKSNIQIPDPGGFTLQRLNSLFKKMVPVNNINLEFAPGGSSYNEEFLKENKDIIKLSCKEQFKQKFSKDDFECLSGIKDTLMSIIGFTLIKKII